MRYSTLFLLSVLTFTAEAKVKHTVVEKRVRPSHIVYDINKKEILSYADDTDVKPIASLTKLMTALITVESHLQMDELVPYKGGIWRDKKVKRADLLESLLIRSDNAAAEALASSYPGGRDVFIQTMNFRAKSLGMYNTAFEDPSGLSHANVSTAKDLSLLVIRAYEHRDISNTSITKLLKVETKRKKKITYMSVGNTNFHLLSAFDSITLSKTGFTSVAGRCLALMVEKENSKYAIIILGERTPGEREKKAKHLINLIPS